MMNQQVPVAQTSAAEGMEAAVSIIGYGTAGVNALIALRTAGYLGKIRVFSNTRILPYSPILTSYYAGGEKAYEECFPWSADELDSLNAEVLLESPVVELDTKAHLIHTPHGAYKYTKCVIATGASPVSWSLADTSGIEPLKLRTMDDAERLKTALSKPGCERVLVSGASMVALKILEACLNYGLETTLVGMNPHVLDFNALPEAATRFEKGLGEKGVQLRLGQTIKSVEVLSDEPHSLERRHKVTFSTGEAEVYDYIAVAHGMKCNLGFVAKDSLSMDAALLVDDFMRTSDPDIYAAGDVAQALELISGDKHVVGNWKNAAVQGACAGKAIAAELAGVEIPADTAYKGSIATNTIGIKGMLFISAGTMHITPSRHVEVHETEEMMVVSVFEDKADSGKRLVAFNIVCDEDESGSKAYDMGAMLTLRIEEAL